ELVAPAYYWRRMDMGWFWQRTEAVQINGTAVRILNPTAQLVHLGSHVGLHHQDKPRLIWFYDLALLVTRRGGELDWQAANAYALRAGLARPIRYALEGMQDWWGVPIPAEAETLFIPSRFD